MLKRLDHVAIAVHSVEKALPLYTEGMGLTLVGWETVADQGVRTAILKNDQEHIELMEATEPDSPVGRFLKKRGEGIHHTCYQVDDIEKALADLKQKGFRLIDETPRIGVGGCRIAFIHPQSTHGVLLELKEVRS